MPSWAALALAAAVVVATPAFAQSATLAVTPRPLSLAPGEGPPVVIGAGARIREPAGDAGARQAVAYLRQLLLRTGGPSLCAGQCPPPPASLGQIAFRRSAQSDLGREGYRLEIGQGRAVVSAPTDAGLFYGAVTLWQLLTPDGRGRARLALAPATIIDRPRFAWRGLLLDSARHFQSPAFVERLLDAMALHKLNVLQWHLTDDQGWRIQIRRYPRLTSVGAWRAAIDPATGKPTRYGGFYTQAQIRRIVAHAARRHVTIVPEIEMPGHSLSAILAYPALGSAAADPRTQGDWGIFPDILAPSDHTLAFMEGVLSEVMALFPGRWINVGGDEAVKDEWRASSAVQGQIKALGLADETALQGWFTGRIGAFLAAHGRRMIGWDDILGAGPALPGDAAVVSWHLDGAAKAIAAGHDAVIATDPTLYFDHRQSEAPGEPPGRGSVVSIADVYGEEPAPAALGGDAAHILGVQANLWSEHMPTEADVEAMAFPRAAALAEVAWTMPERKDFADFEARLPEMMSRYRALGVRADEPPAAGTEPTANVDPAAPGRLASQQLGLCTQKLVLNLEAPRSDQRAQRYLVDIMNPCWIYPQADLSAGATLRVAATRLPFNFQLGADRAKIVQHPPATPAGELEVRADGCAGSPVATLSLAEAERTPGVAVLSATLPPEPGRHDLCLLFAAARPDPMWVVGWAEVGPAAQAAETRR